MTIFSFSENVSLFDGKFDCSLSWNDGMVLEAKVIVVMLVHENGPEISKALDSVIHQNTTVPFALLLVDDSKSQSWRNHAIEAMVSPCIIHAKIPSLGVARTRNLANRIVREFFGQAEWICRLDADDELATQNVLESMYRQLGSGGNGIKWALAGNSLEKDSRLLKRENRAIEQLMQRAYVLERLQGMAEGKSEAELPSCNLWIRTGFKAVYPEVESAEDHWLVAHLLIKHSDVGRLFPDILHAKYTLSGNTTQRNCASGMYAESRQALYRSALFWAGGGLISNAAVCLGWGFEGVVWKKDEQITKRFHSLILDNSHVKWLQNLPSLPMPQAKWSIINGRWEAKYPFEPTNPAVTVSLPMLSRFIEKCLAQQVVYLNITRSNFRIKDNDLYHIDIGSWVVPFEVRYFRDMCTQLHLVFVQGTSDDDLTTMMRGFRNDVGAMKQFDGFEQFYHREIHKFVHYQGAFLKPKRDIQPSKRRHENVTLMVKSCAMEADPIEKQAHHIIKQICKFDEFAERVLLLDPKENGFLREYTKEDLEKLFEISALLEKNSLFDRVLISPHEGHEAEITALYQRWFGVESNKTHNREGIPVFPQLWGFEQVSTRYLLQMDADVLIGRSDEDDDVVATILDALRREHVFGVAFNIPQPPGSKFKPYDGRFVPEVRFGLFDLKRMFAERPFPNSVQDEHLTTSWYRSIEQFQRGTSWTCLRGGDPRSWYIHPPNKLKKDIEYYDRAIDLVEQNTVPAAQRREWDLIDAKSEWKYPERDEDIIFTLVFDDSTPHWARAALRSLVIQKDENWGAVVFDNCSKPRKQYWLGDLIDDLGSQFTLVRRRFGPVDDSFVRSSLSQICKHPDPMVISLLDKEILFDNSIIGTVRSHLNASHIAIESPTYIARHPLGLMHGTASVNTNSYNVPVTLRGVRLSKIEASGASVLNRIPDGNEHTLEIPRFLVYNADMNLAAEGSEDLRPTTYIPNMRKLEIDITYICNLACAGCSRSSAQAPSARHMSIETIQRFLDETEEKGIHWESLHILGGEPTLHPNFIEIVTMLDDWFMEHSPETDLKVITNGVSRRTRNNIASIPERWHYDNSFKHDVERDTSHFEPFNLAPIDLPQWRNEDFTRGCYITQDSGIGLTPYGYFHCAIAGGIERIMKLGNGFNEIPEHPWEFLEMMNDYCRFCGHFLSDAFMERSERIGSSVTPETISDSWQTAYHKWEVEGDL